MDIAGEYSEGWLIVTQKYALVFLLEKDEEDAHRGGRELAQQRPAEDHSGGRFFDFSRPGP